MVQALRFTGCALITAAMLGLPLSAQAQLCTISAGAMPFGIYDPRSPANVDSSAPITVSCQNVVSLLIFYTVQISAGISGSFGNRKLVSGASTMNYQLYADAARTSVWGDGSAGTVQITDGYLLQLIAPNVKTYTVYGRIPGSQNVKAGTYTDTPTILVNF